MLSFLTKHKLFLVLIILIFVVFFSFESLLNKPKVVEKNQVPMPSETDTIILFFNLIDEGRAQEAAGMLYNQEIYLSEWIKQFQSIEEVKLTNISGQENGKYEVLFTVKMSNESKNAPIPYYGYNQGTNVRWIQLIQKGGGWLISQINTGP